MPRAYRPRVSTTARAAAAASALGATAWHLYRPGPHRSGPITMAFSWPDGTRTNETLADAEARAEKVLTS